jgi:hypothetical protein
LILFFIYFYYLGQEKKDGWGKFFFFKVLNLKIKKRPLKLESAFLLEGEIKNKAIL